MPQSVAVARTLPSARAPHYRIPMSSILPDSDRLEAPVYGTVFAARAAVLSRLSVGDTLLLVPDPEGVDNPSVWVHAPGGDVVGHLAPDVNRWMVGRMLHGVRYAAQVVSMGAPGTESWKRLIISIRVSSLPS
jgi:hypothetical protein